MNSLSNGNISPRLWQKWLLSGIFIAGSIFVALALGSEFISPTAWFATDNELIIQLRLLRGINAFCVGGALAMGGVACQAVLRNPLADPYILGVSGGAGLGAALAFSLGLTALTIYTIPLAAFGGAFAALMLSIALSGVLVSAGGMRSYNILLCGVVIGSLASSILMFLISTFDFHQLGGITFWLMGDVQCGDIKMLWAMIAIYLLGGTILFICGNQVDLLALDDDFAHNFGIDVRKLTLLLLLTAAMLAGGAVASGGMIGFVGLMVPHILRRIFGPGHRRLFVLSGLCGGAFLVYCDALSRSLLEAREIPIGIICAFLGGPFFLWLLSSKTRRKS